MSGRLKGTPDTWFAVGAGLLCMAWAFAAWLTVIPNQDMLADAIQAQSLLHDPRIVLAFPGQKHAGTIEYPIQVLAEWIAPGNYYIHTVARVFLAFLTGFLAAKLFITLLPKAPRWAFIGAVAVGPAIIHGLSGPPGNSVGVWWLVGNYETSWLLVTAGALVLARALRRDRAPALQFVAAGLLVGAGFYAHPNVVLLIAPLAVLVLLTFGIRFGQFLLTLAGAVVGVIPAAVSYVVNAGITTWDPSHGVWVSLPVYLNVLGLDGIHSYEKVVLPYALGFSTDETFFTDGVQSGLTACFVVVAVVIGAVGLWQAVRAKRLPGPATAIALAWVAAFACLVGFATVVNPVWFYATSLSIMFWITVGALPFIVPDRTIGSLLAVTVIALTAGSTIAHNSAFYGEFPTRMAEKSQRLADLRAAAAAIKATGSTYVYGSYYDAIPIGYVSNGALRTITTHYDRFPMSTAELGQEQVRVAVRRDSEDPWALEGIERAGAECTLAGADVTTAMGGFGIYDCPPTAIDSRR
jgi:hypothetical protein